jgi:dTDP-4-dehydrorhamnose 3,5-epimerase
MGLINEFVQINHSWNKAAGTLRGLHFQKPPMGEVKLIRCIRGAVFVVAVDLRKGSETFLKWHALILTEKDRNMVYIPRGMAHGFITLENESELIYHHSQYFDPLSEMAFHYQDPGINIKWPLKPRVISEKDQNNPFINEDFEGFIF